MKKLLLPAVFMLMTMVSLYAQESRVIRMTDLQQMIHSSSSSQIKVINFWATWCAPCIKELPLFEKINEERKDVEVTLVSMDMDLDPNPEKVYKFIDRKGIKSQVVILNEKDPNSWINKIDKSWSGALPATLIINPETGKRKFIEKQLHDGDLEKLIDEIK